MASALPKPPRLLRFGPFEFDSLKLELSDDGRAVHLSAQSQRLLLLLLERPGQLVTREQVRQTLWPEGKHAAVDASINTAVRRLRALLHEGDGDPVYIATVTGQGYRFIAPLQPDPDREPAAPGPAQQSPNRARAAWLLFAPVMVLAWAVSGWIWRDWASVPRMTDVQALTTDGGMDIAGRPASDGKLLYYLDRDGGGWDLMRGDGAPEEATVLPPLLAGENTRLFDISREGGAWLLGGFALRGDESVLYRRPATGGSPVRLGNLQALDAVWAPDGSAVYFSHADGLWRAAADGSAPRELAKFGATPDWLSWAPNGLRMRFTSIDPHSGQQAIWEWQADAARLLPADRPRCCGGWTADGRYFLFSQLDRGQWNLWEQPTANWLQRSRLWPRAPARQISFTPHSSWGAFTGFENGRVTFYQENWREQMVIYQPGASVWRPLLPGRDPLDASFSPNGKALAFLDARDHSIWTADVAGARIESLRRLSPAGIDASAPRWSPDGQWIVYQGGQPGQPTQSYQQRPDGGPARALLAPGIVPGAGRYSPDWSSRNDVVLTISPASGREYLAQASGKSFAPLAGSVGWGQARWSPDGRWLAALSDDQHRIGLFDSSSKHWSVIAQGHAFTVPLWSPDGNVYFQDLLAPNQPLSRFRPGATRPQFVAEFSRLLATGVHRCGFAGFAPDGALLLSLNLSRADLYAARLQLP